MRARLVPVLAVTALSLGACKKQRPAVTPTPVPVTDDRGAAEAAERARREAEERAKREAEERARREAETRLATARAALEATIYFDFDKSDLTADAAAALDAKVPVLAANPSVRVRIEGHTDNRGSDEYNLALGQRRAASARRYLVAKGIDDARIETLSFGEERPAVAADNEAAWARNRRDEFRVLIGGDKLVAPSP